VHVSSNSREEALALLVADIYECAGALRRLGDQIAGTVNQSQARWQLLSVLSDGDWTASTAARRLGLSRQAIQRVADLLVAEHLVRSDDNPNDRRAPLLHLTSKGRTALRSITEASHTWHEAAVRSLSLAQIDTTRVTLRTVTAQCRAAAE